MSWRRVELDAVPSIRRRRVTLDDREFQLRIYWVGRMESWFLDLFDAAGLPVVTGMRLAVSVDLLAQYRADERVPQGALTMLNMAKPGQEIGREDLGDVGRLFWIYPLVPVPTVTYRVVAGEVVAIPGGGGGGPPSFEG